MAIKPVLDIDIDPDDKLGAYVARFKEYEEALRKTPGMWGSAAGEAETLSASFSQGVAALLAMLDAAKKVTTEGEKQEQAANRRKNNVRQESLSWRDIANSSKTVATNIKNNALSLAKWAGIGTVLSGLAGFGGLFGLDRLANSVGAGRRSSQGLGLSYGEQKAFQTDFGRLVDPNSMLGGVNEALSDVSKRRYLYAAGLTPGDINGRDTSQVSVALLQSVKALADQTNPEMLGQLLTSRGLGQFGLSVEDLRRLRATPQSDLGEFISQLQHDQTSMGLDEATQRKYQDLSRILSVAKNNIESAFVKGLVPLAPELTKLSESASKAIVAFLGAPEVKKDLEEFSGYLDSPGFKNDVKDFVDNISSLAKATNATIKSFGTHETQDTIFGTIAGFLMGGPAGAAVGALAGNFVGTLRDGRQITNAGHWVAGEAAKSGYWAQDETNPADKGHWVSATKAKPGYWVGASPVTNPDDINDPNSPSYRNRPAKWYDPGSWQSNNGGLGAEQMNGLFQKLGWSPQAAAALQGNAAWESGGDPNKYGDNGQAYGLFQWHKNRQDDFARWAGKSIIGSSAEDQVRFADYELRHGKEQRAGNELLGAKSTEEATRYVDRDFERPADPMGSLAQRTALARLSFAAAGKSEPGKPKPPAHSAAESLVAEITKTLRSLVNPQAEAAPAPTIASQGRKQTVTHRVKSKVNLHVKVTSPAGSNTIANAATVASPQ